MKKPTEINNNLFEELGIADLSTDKKEQLAVRMTEAVLKRIFLETMEKLDEEGRDEYEHMVKNGATPEQMEKFLRSKIEDYDTLVSRAVADFKKEIVSIF